LNELSLSQDLNVITAEINSYKQMAGQAIFEIGKRLKHVKENELAGEFTKYCETELSFNYRQARRYINAYEKFSHMTLGADLSLKKMDLLSSFDLEELETPVEVESGEVKKLTEMTQREIQEYKNKLKQAEEERNRLGQLLTEERNKPPVEKVIEKVVDNTDYNIVSQLERQIQDKQRYIETLERKSKQSEQDADNYRKLKEDLNNLRDRRDDMVRQIDNAGTIGKFVARVDKSFEEDLAPIKYSRAIEELHQSRAVMESLEGIVSKVENWCKEIRSLMPNKNIIDVEVIDYE
jgi:DNA repair exonuclease SbcCD ATPase subunit